MSSVGTHIRRLRTARHMTQEQLAERLFVTRQAVSAWETGKALPDVETLERIAAALEAGVTEVIYGVPKTPDLKRQQRKWMATGGITASILAVILIIFLKNGGYGTWRHGLAYQFFDSNYAVHSEMVPWSMELDLTDLESNAEKVLYEDETGCRIVVDQVDENRPGEYRVWFRSHGVYDRAGGTLVSGCHSVPAEKTTHTLSMSAGMTALVDGRFYPCSVAGESGLLWKDGNQFGFHLNPRNEDHLPYRDVPIEGVNSITVNLTGLTRFSSRRLSYWDIY